MLACVSHSNPLYKLSLSKIWAIFMFMIRILFCKVLKKFCINSYVLKSSVILKINKLFFSLMYLKKNFSEGDKCTILYCVCGNFCLLFYFGPGSKSASGMINPDLEPLRQKVPDMNWSGSESRSTTLMRGCLLNASCAIACSEESKFWHQS
jgi:hypothetical protein